MKHRKPQQPWAPAWLYHLLRLPVAFLCRHALGYRLVAADPAPAAGPLMVLGAHQGMLDAFFMAASFKRRLHFVTTERFFRVPWLGWVLRRLGVIPRIQFQSDPRSIAAMLRVTRTGGAIGLFPAGQTSMSGRPGNIAPTIARLVKKSGATVVALGLHGSFFTKSRFQSGFNRGRVDGRIRVLFTPEQLEAADEAAVYAAICQALYYDEYAWQAQTGALFKSRARARGLEQVLYRCPRCGADYQMRSQGHRLFCAACGNAAQVGPDMRLTPEAPACVVPPTLTDWYGLEEAAIRAAVDDPARPFVLEQPCAVELYAGSRRYPAGQGTLRLDRAGLWFEGTLAGRPARLGVAHANLFGMAADTAGYLELYDPERGLCRYLPRQPLSIAAWKMAQEYLYSKTLEAQ